MSFPFNLVKCENTSLWVVRHGHSRKPHARVQ